MLWAVIFFLSLPWTGCAAQLIYSVYKIYIQVVKINLFLRS